MDETPTLTQLSRLRMTLTSMQRENVEYPESMKEIVNTSAERLTADACDLLISIGASLVREKTRASGKEKKAED